jgi:hypothetical protein
MLVLSVNIIVPNKAFIVGRRVFICIIKNINSRINSFYSYFADHQSKRSFYATISDLIFILCFLSVM